VEIGRLGVHPGFTLVEDPAEVASIRIRHPMILPSTVSASPVGGKVPASPGAPLDTFSPDG
jgi:hypothetical protein